MVFLGSNQRVSVKCFGFVFMCLDEMCAISDVAG